MENRNFGMNDMSMPAHDKASQAAAGVASQTERLRDTVAQNVESAAGQVKQSFDSAVQYLRNFDAKKVMRDLTDYAKSHPTQTLIGAAIVGFIAGQAMRRR